jgi:hypothetical protein
VPPECDERAGVGQQGQARHQPELGVREALGEFAGDGGEREAEQAEQDDADAVGGQQGTGGLAPDGPLRGFTDTWGQECRGCLDPEHPVNRNGSYCYKSPSVMSFLL